MILCAPAMTMRKSFFSYYDFIYRRSLSAPRADSINANARAAAVDAAMNCIIERESLLVRASANITKLHYSLRSIRSK